MTNQEIKALINTLVDMEYTTLLSAIEVQADACEEAEDNALDYFLQHDTHSQKLCEAHDKEESIMQIMAGIEVLHNM